MSSTQATDDAPLSARRDDKADGYAYVGRSVLIDKPRQELFAFWRDFHNLPQFMTSLDRVETKGPDLSVWTVKAPVGQTVEIETRVTNVVEGQSIGWQSTENSQIRTKGEVRFEDAPAGRGTIVTADIAYQPPGGDIGRVVAKLFAAEPNIQARHELKRFKMLMEAGEIATPLTHKEDQ